ncbi:uncharacterized protein F5147DRAFT_695260 [Suillus discolor]|uniref:Copper-fist domain-containing protein n=1 Tax=Suillus discolor TaxID=1912936 RepID=A0A9P7F8Q0_9AGAM|nr:uncharacterized protein F5147DRAFT_695260 [Suillus discolor]KAG2108499.1 hypothetical protein F5147DRAFT_695260 [Suillus discolor]
MVLVSDKKYACETCIKGHRSSACKHTDRPLFEIKKKGRPVTQCEHCRELRKTKQVHVKCSCGSQDQGATGAHEASHSKKGTPKLPATAAFPHGLPEALETLATLLPASDDSDHSGETSPTGCRCSSGGPCNCCIPRKPATRRRFSGAEPPKRDKLHSDSSKHHESLSPPLSSHVLARIAELRPVLPKPAHRQHPLDGSLHNPSSSVPHGHNIRHHNYDFSPYGRAYGYTHSDHIHDQKGSSLTSDPRTFAGRSVQSPQQTLGSQPVPDAWSPAEVFPSVCACGDSCMCPGCTLHNNPPITGGATFASCSNPSSCAFCLDCTILSIPASNPPPNIDSSSDPSQSQEFDEWLRQVALSPGVSNSQSNFNPYELTTPQTQSYQSGRPRIPETPSPPVGCCGGRCKCSRNCACLPDCCGCCQGCQCDNHCNDARSRTTFAVSGERGSCCRKADPNTNALSAGRRLPEFMAMTNIRDQLSASGVGAGSQGYYGQQGAFVDYSEAPSRSSSGSSLASRAPTRPPSGLGSRLLGQSGPSSSTRSPPAHVVPSGSTRGFATYAESERARGAAPYSSYNPSLDAMRFD